LIVEGNSEKNRKSKKFLTKQKLFVAENKRKTKQLLFAEKQLQEIKMFPLWLPVPTAKI